MMNSAVLAHVLGQVDGAVGDRDVDGLVGQEDHYRRTAGWAMMSVTETTSVLCNGC
jgi:hypothetical protein